MKLVLCMTNDSKIEGLWQIRKNCKGAQYRFQERKMTWRKIQTIDNSYLGKWINDS